MCWSLLSIDVSSNFFSLSDYDEVYGIGDMLLLDIGF